MEMNLDMQLLAYSRMRVIRAFEERLHEIALTENPFFGFAHLYAGAEACAVGGDGASNQGAVFESLNLAKVLELPVVFVLEDNGYVEATSKTYSCAGDFVDRVAGFGIPAQSETAFL